MNLSIFLRIRIRVSVSDILRNLSALLHIASALRCFPSSGHFPIALTSASIGQYSTVHPFSRMEWALTRLNNREATARRLCARDSSIYCILYFYTCTVFYRERDEHDAREGEVLDASDGVLRVRPLTMQYLLFACCRFQ